MNTKMIYLMVISAFMLVDLQPVEAKGLTTESDCQKGCTSAYEDCARAVKNSTPKKAEVCKPTYVQCLNGCPAAPDQSSPESD